MRFSKLAAATACLTALAVAGCSTPAKRRGAKPATTAAGAPATAASPAGSRDQRYAQAVQQVRAGQWQAAEAAMLALAKAYPQYSGPQTNLGIIYLRTNRKDQALAAFTRAVTLNPRNAVAHTGIGVLAAAAGDIARAEQAYKAALTADPTYGLAHLNLGILYERNLNRPDAALVEYRLYQDHGGKDDLKATLWIADLEQKRTSAGSGS